MKAKGIVSGYVIEIVLATLVTGFACSTLGEGRLCDFVHQSASEWAQLTTAFFGAAVAAWLTFANFRATEFGDFLDDLGAISVFSKAFLVSIYVHLFATVASIGAKGSNWHPIAILAAFLLCYSLINVVTLFSNAAELIHLYGQFRRQARSHRQEGGSDRRMISKDRAEEC